MVLFICLKITTTKNKEVSIMGLPEIIIDFKTKSSTAITRSSRGVVAMIIKDDTDSATSYTYTSVTKVDNDKFSVDSKKYIAQVFKSYISKLLIQRITDDNTLDKALNKLSKEPFNYLCYPEAESGDNEKISLWIKSQRQKNKTYKAVLSKTQADHEGIINYVSTCVDINGDTYTPDKYTPRIAGIFASIPFTISSTYYKLPELEDAINDIEDLDSEVDTGKLILIKDDGVVKIGRGVNSFTTTSITKGNELKKIRIVEIIDMIKDDIYKTVKDNYIGRVSNTYDNKMICVSAINSYLFDLARDGILGDGDNKVDIDVEAHRLYLMFIGKTEEQVNQMDDTTLRKCRTGSNLYLTGNIVPVDCIEDIKIEFNI